MYHLRSMAQKLSNLSRILISSNQSQNTLNDMNDKTKKPTQTFSLLKPEPITCSSQFGDYITKQMLFMEKPLFLGKAVTPTSGE